MRLFIFSDYTRGENNAICAFVARDENIVLILPVEEKDCSRWGIPDRLNIA